METEEAIHKAFDLSGQVALVTGAGSGLGRTSAEVLSLAGANVICADINAQRCEGTVAAITEAGYRARAYNVDVSIRGEVESMVADVVATDGRLDVMCNVAGIMMDSKILDLTLENFDRVMSVNLKGTLFGCQAAGRAMVAQGHGSIINMASAAVLTPAPEIGAYAMSKAAVVQLTKTLSMELGRKGVRVNTVAPGFIPTNMTARYYTRPDGTVDEDLKAAVLGPMARFSPLGRVGEPLDVAYCILYLASNASSFVTGQMLSPNGGVAMA